MTDVTCDMYNVTVPVEISYSENALKVGNQREKDMHTKALSMLSKVY